MAFKPAETPSGYGPSVAVNVAATATNIATNAPSTWQGLYITDIVLFNTSDTDIYVGYDNTVIATAPYYGELVAASERIVRPFSGNIANIWGIHGGSGNKVLLLLPIVGCEYMGNTKR